MEDKGYNHVVHRPMVKLNVDASFPCDEAYVARHHWPEYPHGVTPGA